MTATLTIKKGIVDVLCESSLSGSDEYDGQVQLRALDLTVAVISTYGFAKGEGLTAILETVVKPDGILYNLNPYHPRLEALVTAIRPQSDGGIDVQPILEIALSDPTICVALVDLISSLHTAQEATVRCARAVDAIRHYMAPQNDRKAGWPAMRENLNLTQQYLEFITDASKGPRHGEVKSNTFSTSQEVLKRAWTVMNRFLEFKIRGNQRLPFPEFPIL